MSVCKGNWGRGYRRGASTQTGEKDMAHDLSFKGAGTRGGGQTMQKEQHCEDLGSVVCSGR